MPAASSEPVPLVVSISALDSRKEENIERSDLLVSHGVGVFAVDVPGTGEAPITADVGSERIFSRLLDVLLARPDVDPRRVAVQSVSWGAHWAAKLAIMERQRIRAANAYPCSSRLAGTSLSAMGVDCCCCPAHTIW